MKTSKQPSASEPVEFQIFPKEAINQISVAHKYFLEQISGAADSLSKITNADAEILRNNIFAKLDALVGEEKRKEIEQYVNAFNNAKKWRERNIVPIPSAVVKNNTGKRMTDDQREIRTSIKNLLYLSPGPKGTGELLGERLTKGTGWLVSIDSELGFEKPMQCPVCSKQGVLYIAKESLFQFRCDGCGHSYGRFPQQYSYINGSFIDQKLSKIVEPCVCQFCKTQKETLAACIRAVLVEHEAEIFRRYNEWRCSLSAYTGVFPDNLQMLRDYELNKNSIGKTLRAILDLKPTSGEDLLKCAEMYCESNNGDVYKILKESFNKKIAYRNVTYNAIEAQSLRDILAYIERVKVDGRWLFGDQPEDSIHLMSITDQLLNAPLHVIAESLYVTEMEIVIISKMMTSYRGFDSVNFYSSYGSNYNECLARAVFRARQTNNITINPYYINPPELRVVTSDVTPVDLPRLGRLFNSQTELNAYRRLTSEYADCLIIPNRLLRQVLGFDSLNAIRTHFSQEENNYLWKCEVDLVVYDQDGNLLRVEEIQRGDHHNNQEWVRKDALKRKALALAGVFLTESF
jgi:hypothetical protein